MFALTGFDKTAARLARAWLVLGIAALAGAGLLAILLALSRTPGVQDLLPQGDFFRAALIVHVDLSVLIWFMAFAAVLWSLAGSGRFAAVGTASVSLAALGTLLMVVSPFFPDARPLLNNYIPILRQPVFFAGLLLAGAGFALAMLRGMATIRVAGDPARLAVLLSALIGAAAFVATVLAWATLPDTLEGQGYFEMLFWGGGHVLQFQHALLAALAWLWLAQELGVSPRLTFFTSSLVFALAALPVLAVPVILLAAPAGSGQYIAYFARLMEFGHPLLLPLMVLALIALWRARSQSSPAKSALAASLTLFIVGGVLGYLIRGVNVVIPAHYHGAIVGVTLAFMGLTYVLLPKLGFGEANGRMARWQPYVYGGGQLLHVLGLAWSGGYGVQRKVAGAEQMLVTLPQKLGMGLMGLGGLIAVIGGVMFVLICLKAMLNRRP
ncbi:MAG: cbb3-type cytochrome c oxidase subunit I [Gammaproteobacteria bacterium]|nr:cbb3-type cytochrome c oxidase subunit I [Gammaproteobacteria bacterium]MBU1416625.1 cbb3-type cytochrome c oxidase subunit I [Gammaproteobacteria bacterium]